MAENNIIAGAGGGCFRLGTKIQQPNGVSTSIEELKVGDTVLSFDEYGNIHESKVIEVHYHQAPEPLTRVRFWRGYVDITPNHWVLNQYEAFVEMGRLGEHDALVDGMGHLRPIISVEKIEPEPVWNLTVFPNHTFIANGIRVHNGGFRERYPVAGSGGGGGGKGGGGARAAIEDKDSLRSKQYAQVVDLLSEGPIVGLANPSDILSCIYLDGTPLSDSGSLNFQGVTVVQRTGTQDQTYVSGVSSVDVEKPVNVEIKHDTPIVRSITNPDVDAVRLTLGIPRLTNQDPKTGDIHGSEVEFKIAVNENGGGWVDQIVEQEGIAYTIATNGLTATATTFIKAVTVRIKWKGTALEDTSAIQARYVGFRYKKTTDTVWTEAMPVITTTPALYLSTSPSSQRIFGRKESSLFWGVSKDKEVIDVVTKYDTYGQPLVYTTKIVKEAPTVEKEFTFELPESAAYNFQVYYKTTVIPAVSAGTGITYAGTFTMTSCMGAIESPRAIIKGKSSSRYQKSYRIPLYGSGPWDIRVTRVTPDATTSNISNVSFWDSYTEIIETKLRYPNSAYIAATIDSEQFQSIPTRGYDIKGLIVKVPNNYDPDTRKYTGIWDGTFKLAWTDNPAWCFYDLLTNTRYGIGSFINESNLDFTKWELYSIARYCDAVSEVPGATFGDFVGVPDGYGGIEPRFTCNLYLQTREEAYKVLNTMASIFRGIIYWANGAVIPVQDAPSTPAALFSPANVIGGQFSYQGTSIRTRHNVALVTWNNPSNGYTQSIEYVEDREGILNSTVGVIETEVLAVGCTSRGQAHRLGKWLLYTERLESETITFKTGLEGLVVRPGEIINTTDPVRSGVRLGGRIASCPSLSTVELDSSVPIEVGSTYTLMIVMPDGSISSKSITNTPGLSYTVLNLSTPLSEQPVANAIWVLSSNNLIPETWRIIGIKESDGVHAEISAISHNPSKFAFVENDIDLQVLPTYNTSLIPSRPEDGSIYDSIYFNGGSVCTKLLVSWEPSNTAYRYFVKYKKADNNWVDMVETSVPSIDIENVSDGFLYTVRVYSVNPLGVRSTDFLELSRTVLGKTVPPTEVDTFVSTVDNDRVVLTWSEIADIDKSDYGVSSTTPWDTGNVIWTASTSITLPPATAGTHTYTIKSRDTTGNVSTDYTSTSFTILSPLQPTLSSSISADTLLVSWNDCKTTHNISKYLIKVDIANNGWDALAVTYESVGTSISIPVTWIGSSTKILVRSVDIAGNQSTTASTTVSVTNPTVNTFTNIKQLGEAVLSWTSTPGSLSIKEYEVRYGSSWASSQYITKVSANQLKYAINWASTQTFWIKAIDVAGNTSTAVSQSITISPPSAPTLSKTFEGNTVRLSWTDCSTDLPIDYYEIKRGATWETAADIGKAYSNSMAIVVDWDTSATFWVRAKDINAINTADNYGPISSYVVTILVPDVPMLSYEMVNGQCILSWNEVAQASLPIQGYEVRYGGSWEVGAVLGITQDGTLQTPASWTGPRTFYLNLFDTSGKYSTATSATVTPTVYSAPTGLSLVQSLTDLVFSWQPATGGTAPIDYYEIRYGGSWESGAVVGKSKTTTLTVPITWVGSRTFWVHAVDVYGKIGSASSTSFSITAPGLSTISNTIVGVKAQLSWNVPTSTLPIDHYIIKTGSTWETSTLLTKQTGTDYRMSIDWVGNKTVWVVAVDVNNNLGTPGSTNVLVSVPQSPSISSTLSISNFILSWNTPIASLPITNYEVRYGTSWASGTLYGRSNTNTISIEGSWLGNREFWVSAIDINGNYGTAGSVTLSILAPPEPPNYRQEVVDNNVLLYWGYQEGTLPILTYQIRKGANWATSELIGDKSGGFTTIFETTSGTFTYWIAAIDSASNLGTPTSLSCTVNQPPDYVLKANYDSTLDGTTTNIFKGMNRLVLPVSSTESFQNHFTSRGWTTPQNQVDALYPMYAQPNLRPATYVEQFDYGTILAANKITLTVNQQNVVGTVDMIPTISTSSDGITWSDSVDVLQTFATNFRYVKISITWNAADDKALAEVFGINVRLDSKLKTTTATIPCIAPVSGTYTQAGTSTVTVTATGTWTVGQLVQLDFTSGTATDGIFSVVTGGSGSFTVNRGTSATTSGNVTVDSTGTPLALTEDRTLTGTKSFIDVDAIQVTAAGTTPIVAMYNFVDAPNPLSMQVLLFNNSGTRVSGTASVTVRGF
jgi:predicted phage tail protein